MSLQDGEATFASASLPSCQLPVDVTCDFVAARMPLRCAVSLNICMFLLQVPGSRALRLILCKILDSH